MQKASESLYKIFKATIEDFGVTMEDFASCTTDSGSDVKAMAVNFAKQHGISWDWCFAHMVCKACEHAFGTSPSPAASKNTAAREVIQKVIRVVENIHKSPLQKAKFEDLQVSHTSIFNSTLYTQRVNAVAYPLLKHERRYSDRTKHFETCAHMTGTVLALFHLA